MEPCPPDSLLTEDTCKCNPELCSKPPCLHDLHIATNGSDTPGQCCPLYSCDNCPEEDLIQGLCPCAPDAVINAQGACNCVQPHFRLLEGKCVCDPDDCPLPQLCGDNHVEVKRKEGCCVHTECIECPEDSFPTTNADEAVENKCVCYPCKKKECGEGESVVVMQRALGFPGMYHLRWR